MTGLRMTDLDTKSVAPQTPSRDSGGSSANTNPSQRQSSDTMSPNPPASASSTSAMHLLPSNQTSFNRARSLQTSPTLSQGATTGALSHPIMCQDPSDLGNGTMPIRHPRPLTAADLHTQVEQEQELLVNRLTRDLSLLRAQSNPSVVSNASSTSDHPQYPFVDPQNMAAGFSVVPLSTSRRHNRTSSSASTRSISQVATAGSTPGPVSISHGAASTLEAARNPRGSMQMSRQESTASGSTGTSRNRSPQPQPALATNNDLTAGITSLQYEQVVHYRQELEAAKRENELLKRRIKELEKQMRQRRASDSSSRSNCGSVRPRSDSVSTAASVSMSGATGVGGGGTSIAGGRRTTPYHMERMTSSTSVSGSVGVGVPEEEVQMGESAASAAQT